MIKKDSHLSGYTLGVDVGTTNAKAGIFDLESGQIDHLVSRAYAHGKHVDCRQIWASIKEAVLCLFEKAGHGCPVKAIGLSGQMHGSVFWDKDKKFFKEIINWQDQRADIPLEKYGGKTTVDRINEKMSAIQRHDLGIDRIPSGYMLSTLFYLKENEKDFFDGIRYVSLPTDLIRASFLGGFDGRTDRTNAASSGIFDVKRLVWHKELLELLQLPQSLLPQVCKTSDIAGFTSAEANHLFGFKKSIPVIVGGGDNQLSIYGSGVDFFHAKTLLNIGTGSQISKIVKKYQKIKGIETRCYLDDDYILVGASLGGGTSYDKLQKELGISFQEMDNLACTAEPGANGLRYSTGPTRLDPKRKEGFYGRAGSAGSVPLRCRAVMEGVLSDLFRYYTDIGGEEDGHIIASGGGFINSSIWPQIAADMFDKKIWVTTFESTILGSALLAARSVGLSCSHAAVFHKKRYKEYLPDKRNSSLYRALFSRDQEKEKR
jgi:xylulokinase